MDFCDTRAVTSPNYGILGPKSRCSKVKISKDQLGQSPRAWCLSLSGLQKEAIKGRKPPVRPPTSAANITLDEPQNGLFSVLVRTDLNVILQF